MNYVIHLISVLHSLIARVRKNRKHRTSAFNMKAENNIKATSMSTLTGGSLSTLEPSGSPRA